MESVDRHLYHCVAGSPIYCAATQPIISPSATSDCKNLDSISPITHSNTSWLSLYSLTGNPLASKPTTWGIHGTITYRQWLSNLHKCDIFIKKNWLYILRWAYHLGIEARSWRKYTPTFINLKIFRCKSKASDAAWAYFSIFPFRSTPTNLHQKRHRHNILDWDPSLSQSPKFSSLFSYQICK